MKTDGKDYANQSAQRGIKGNLIVYPQSPSDVARKLPLSIDEITSPICVLFIGAHPPSTQWLREKAKPLAVRGNKVRQALLWLKAHNRLYKNIEIDEGLLTHLDSDPVLPFHVEHVTPSLAMERSTDGYDPSQGLSFETSDTGNLDSFVPTNSTDVNPEVLFASVLITDVDNAVSSSQLAAAAIRHLRRKGGGYLQIPHQPQPSNEFSNPDLFPMLYPTLFPYGIGGFDDNNRRVTVSMRRQVKHLLQLHDRRFQEHYSFLFTAFNILQHHEMLLQVGLKAKKKNFNSVASYFGRVSTEAIHAVADRIANGDHQTANTSEEQQVLELMKQVNTVSLHIQGSAASKAIRRSELKALMIDQGLPSFYLTINPSDVHNPLVRFLAGSDINIDTVLPTDYNNFSQTMLVSKNPFATAKFFNMYMHAFIQAILGYNKNRHERSTGILGKVKAYYGCVEAQGRGTLHCHMLVWVEGGLNPDEIKKRVLANDDEFKQRLTAFLDDTISNYIPPDATDFDVPPYHPCSVRCPPAPENHPNYGKYLARDKHLLVQHCQYHRHSATCYKYDIHSCRFDMHESNYKPISCFDPQTGELKLRCLNGLVNNFNETMLQCIRCNMDIKFIGSGTSAKAILYYITDYITKSQLKTHVAYAALELAVSRLSEYDPTEDDLTYRAKRLLQRCAYAMISHQELSAPQVASYLLDYNDYFTSHSSIPFYWRSAEAYVNKEKPLVNRISAESSHSTNDESATMHSSSRTSPVGEASPQSEPDILDTSDPQHTSTSLYHSQSNEESEETPDADLLEGQNDADNVSEDEDEVVLQLDSQKNLVAGSSPLDNYLCRSNDLADLCYWDYISRVEKVSKKSDQRKHRKAFDRHESSDPDDIDADVYDADPSPDFEDEETSDSEPVDNNIPCLWDLHLHFNKHLKSTKKSRPRVEFTPSHSECNTHYQCIRLHCRRLVPVPVGPSIPRRDREETKERHARLMLILLKPWTTVEDLLPQGWCVC